MEEVNVNCMPEHKSKDPLAAITGIIGLVLVRTLTGAEGVEQASLSFLPKNCLKYLLLLTV